MAIRARRGRALGGGAYRGRGLRAYKGSRRRSAAFLFGFRAQFVDLLGGSFCPHRRLRYLRPRSGPWCSRTSTMSLSRSEEMHRLTENVYKVSPAPPARLGPAWRLRALRGLPGAAAEIRPRPVGYRCARAPLSRQPALPWRALNTPGTEWRGVRVPGRRGPRGPRAAMPAAAGRTAQVGVVAPAGAVTPVSEGIFSQQAFSLHNSVPGTNGRGPGGRSRGQVGWVNR